ncbi:hypothetical protein KIH39_13875 [Telmatocola sphagniphila]|uniref:Lipid A biosynthesis acyltransferase n=1 Tax=Telmatocola sphagniphila TaxID=1123043 RepID=A0A8E6B3P2_9BACT|nr:hypothetical protein [Telmatocola sphagniphila]QVL29958.1 hypothetical protein KIH39_13875 [Telmatocola sphagniphila]
MAAKVRSLWVDWLVYLAVRVVIGVIQAVPLSISMAFAKILAQFLHFADKRHRLVALENLRYALPELSEDERKKLVRKVYRHLCLMLVEMIVFSRKLHVHNWIKYIQLKIPTDILCDLIEPKKPVLLVTAHYGNWEIAGYVLGLLGLKSYAIARTLDNPYLEVYLKKFRQKTGQTILAKKGDFDRITEILGAGGKLATLGDQDAGQKGLFVDFFNRPASTHKAVALMAMEFDTRMVIVGVPRIKEPLFFCVEVEDVIEPRQYAHLPDGVRLLTERYNKSLERLIRRHPEQYFWLHRRWKHQPRARAAKPALNS